MMPEQQQRILGYFIEEAKDHLNTIEQGLLNLQATIQDPEMVTEVFRAAHSVKGGAAMLSLGSIQKTSHRLEDYFKLLKEAPTTQVDRDLESMFLQIFDGLQALLEELQGPFGLTEDKAQEVMADVEPVFEQLEGHLNQLIATAPATAPAATPAAATSAQPSRKASASSEDSALKLVFSSDVPSHLREMLTLFKQTDSAASRTALQGCCEALQRIGEQFDLSPWRELTAATQKAVGNPEQTYRSLAPVIIKELKRAQELVLSGQANAIAISAELESMLPLTVETEEAIGDIDSLLDDALSTNDEPDLADLFESDAQTTTEADADFDLLDLGDDDPDAAIAGEDDVTGILDTFDEAAAESVETPREPTVGAAELNSLADLFEGEVSELDSPWEEISESEAAIADNASPDIDLTDDFSDLLDDSLEDEGTDASDDLADLFGDTVTADDQNVLNDHSEATADATAESDDDLQDLFDLAEPDGAEATIDDLPADTTAESDDLDAFLDESPTDEMTAETSPAPPETGAEEALDLDFSEDEESVESNGLDLDFDSLDGTVEDASLDLEFEMPEAEASSETATEAAFDLDFETPNDIETTDDELDALLADGDDANTMATLDEALASSPASEHEVAEATDIADSDLSGSDELFAAEAIADPWSTEEGAVDPDDASALDALDELWTDTDSQPASTGAAEAADDPLNFDAAPDLEPDLIASDETSSKSVNDTSANDEFGDLFEEDEEEATDDFLNFDADPDLEPDLTVSDETSSESVNDASADDEFGDLFEEDEEEAADDFLSELTDATAPAAAAVGDDFLNESLAVDLAADSASVDTDLDDLRLDETAETSTPDGADEEFDDLFTETTDEALESGLELADLGVGNHETAPAAEVDEATENSDDWFVNEAADASDHLFDESNLAELGVEQSSSELRAEATNSFEGDDDAWMADLDVGATAETETDFFADEGEAAVKDLAASATPSSSDSDEDDFDLTFADDAEANLALDASDSELDDSLTASEAPATSTPSEEVEATDEFLLDADEDNGEIAASPPSNDFGADFFSPDAATADTETPAATTTDEIDDFFAAPATVNGTAAIETSSFGDDVSDAAATAMPEVNAEVEEENEGAIADDELDSALSDDDGLALSLEAEGDEDLLDETDDFLDLNDLDMDADFTASESTSVDLEDTTAESAAEDSTEDDLWTDLPTDEADLEIADQLADDLPETAASLDIETIARDEPLAVDPAADLEIENDFDLDLGFTAVEETADATDELFATPAAETPEAVDEQPASTDDFGDLDALLDDESAIAPEAEAAPETPTDDAGFDELEDLLEDDSSITATEGVAETTAPDDGDVDFGELDALIGDNQGLTSTDDTPINDGGDADDDFGDLEKLLEEADQTLGGGSSTIRTAGPGRSPRRVGGIVDQTMRVSVKHLDNLNNLVGELVVNRNSLEQDQERFRQFLDNLLFQVQQLNDVGQRMRDLYERSLLESSLLASRQAFQTGGTRVTSGNGSNGDGHATGASFDALEMDRFTGFHTLTQEMIELIVRVRESSSDIAYTVESTDQIARQFRQVTTQLQEGLNKARMVPFAQTADRLPRAVRDISIKCGKEARLVVEGRDTLIDKMLLERLYDPMTHLVNNAITHGVESPEERAAIGKPREGTITVRAFYQGNQTVIYIQDDGAGINPDVVRRKAIQKGLITQAEADSMNQLETYELLFRHGFSTRDQADDFAGRGVGMDVVRSALSEIRGSINIDSELGRGTSFTIRLPLTLSISKALSCLNNQARIAFPMDGVEDMFDVPRERIQTDNEDRNFIQWRDMALTFQPLSELLQFNRSLGRGRVYGGSQDDDMVSIVVLRNANTYIGIEVDRVLGEQEIVIKQIEGPVPKPMGIAGATVLGDGRVMPIADVLELIDIAQGRVRREVGSSLWSQVEQPPEEEAPVQHEPTVLIVDDSITVRELLSMSFNKVGYRVEQARDGQEAWEKMRSGLPCDLVFCDIEMPRMDGLELLSRMQKDGLLSQIPIAMLTSRGADRHRQMALDLGASGYFTKPYLEEALLEAAQRMLKGEVLLTSAAVEEAEE